MGIGDAITFVSCFAGLMLALPALMIFLGMTFTRTSAAAAERLHHGFIMPLVVGTGVFALLAIPASLLVSMGSVFQLWLFGISRGEHKFFGRCSAFG